MSWNRVIADRARVIALVVAVVALAASRATAQSLAPTTGPHGTLRTVSDCAACHTAEAWSPARARMDFDHTKAGFALTGAHTATSCGACHLDLRFDAPKLGPTECGTCHVDVHQQRLPGSCASCHNTTSFSDAGTLEQHARTSFPLTGAHIQVSCESCHPSARQGEFSAQPADCAACHAGEYRSAQRVDHVAAAFPADCGSCHNTTTWVGAGFDHAQAAGFALLGQHAEVSCSGCHAGAGNALRFGPAGENDCLTCHRLDYEREHSGDGIPNGCVACHTVAGWSREPFDHAAEGNGYMLRGRHLRVACTDCHATDQSPRFSPASEDDCVACHRTDYDREHTSSGYPVTCLTCHGEEQWERSAFDHGAAANGFVLLGGHRQAPCASCHVPPDNALRFAHPAGNDDCVACHRSDYDREHASSGYPTTCLSCHTVDDWNHATFDHTAISQGFALLGAHQAAPCASCHTQPGNQLKFPQPSGNDDCVACHQVDYDREHQNSGFATTCLSCHTIDSWATANFDHTVVSNGFALQGAHQTATCASCHVQPGNQLKFPQPSGNDDCVACHQSDYNAEHLNSGFPLTCLSCHNQNTFTGATFDHAAAANGFALIGAHQSRPCSSCHTQPGNQLKFPHPSGNDDCIACHQSDYNAEHLNSGFPLTCLSCHNQNTFTGAVFDHDAMFFPINSGKHAGKWSSCAQCHPTPANMANFTCLSCHEHNQKEMDDKHKDEQGYAYVSALCLQCHPSGRK